MQLDIAQGLSVPPDSQSENAVQHPPAANADEEDDDDDLHRDGDDPPSAWDEAELDLHVNDGDHQHTGFDDSWHTHLDVLDADDPQDRKTIVVIAQLEANIMDVGGPARQEVDSVNVNTAELMDQASLDVIQLQTERPEDLQAIVAQMLGDWVASGRGLSRERGPALVGCEGGYVFHHRVQTDDAQADPGLGDWGDGQPAVQGVDDPY